MSKKSKIFSAEQARISFSNILDMVQYDKETVFIKRFGEIIAEITPVKKKT